MDLNNNENIKLIRSTVTSNVRSR